MVNVEWGTEDYVKTDEILSLEDEEA